MTSDPVRLREIYGMVVNGLRREGVTSILTSETHTGLLNLDQDKLGYVVDTILMTRYVEVDSAMERAIMVLKMRGSEHASGIYRFEIQQGGVRVAHRFEGLQGLLTGVPRHTSRQTR
jgi:circadian clock protein KaiC